MNTRKSSKSSVTKSSVAKSSVAKPSMLWARLLAILFLLLLLLGFLGSRLRTPHHLFFGFLPSQLVTPNLAPPPPTAITLYDPNTIEVGNFGPATMVGARAYIDGAPPVYLGTIHPLETGNHPLYGLVERRIWAPHPWPAGTTQYLKVRLVYWVNGYLEKQTYFIRPYPKPAHSFF